MFCMFCETDFDFKEGGKQVTINRTNSKELRTEIMLVMKCKSCIEEGVNTTPFGGRIIGDEMAKEIRPHRKVLE